MQTKFKAFGMAFVMAWAMAAAHAAETPLSAVDQKAWLELRQSMKEAAKKMAEAQQKPIAYAPVRPLGVLERALVSRVVEAARKCKSSETLFHGQLVDAETGKPIAGATVSAETWKSGGKIIGPPKTAVSDKEGRFVLWGEERFAIRAAGYLDWPLQKVEMPLVSEYLLPREKVDAYVDKLISHLHEDRQAMQVWDDFVAGRKVELVRNIPQDLDSRATVLGTRISPDGRLVSVGMFTYKPEECPKKVWKNRARWDEETKKLVSLPDKVERLDAVCTAGLRAIPMLKKMPTEEEMAKKKRPDWEKELLRLKVDVDAIRRMGGGVLVLCNGEGIKGENSTGRYESDAGNLSATSTTEDLREFHKAKNTIETKTQKEIKIAAHEVVDAANVAASKVKWAPNGAPLNQKDENFLTLKAANVAEQHDKFARRWKRPGTYPSRTRLIVVDGRPGDGIQFAPIKYFAPVAAGPSPGIQLHRAPRDGYAREWAVSAEDLALASGHFHPIFAFVRLDGFYGRVLVNGLNVCKEADWQSDYVKKQKDVPWDPAHPPQPSAMPVTGLSEKRDEFRIGLLFRMQEKQGNVNLLAPYTDVW